MSALLGLSLLVTLGLLWRETRRKQGFRNDAQEWKVKYAELMQNQNVLIDIGKQPWEPSELRGEPHLPHQFEDSRPEMDGTQVS